MGRPRFLEGQVIKYEPVVKILKQIRGHITPPGAVKSLNHFFNHISVGYQFHMKLARDHGNFTISTVNLSQIYLEVLPYLYARKLPKRYVEGYQFQTKFNEKNENAIYVVLGQSCLYLETLWTLCRPTEAIQFLVFEHLSVL